MLVRVLDYETENHPWYGELASPRCPQNYVILEGYTDLEITERGVKVIATECIHYKSRDEFLRKYNKTIPEDIDYIVAHNACYELSWLLQYNKKNYYSYLKRGGRVFCTQYAEYLLSRQTDTYPALTDVAPRYGGTNKVDLVKQLWEQGYRTSQIDLELLKEYLMGPCGDVPNTVKIFLGQWVKLQQREMLPMALLRMRGMLFFAECMHNGLYVDTAAAYVRSEELNKTLSKLEQEIKDDLPQDMPDVLRTNFNLSSIYHRSALLFGGALNYSTRVNRTDSDGNIIYVKEPAARFSTGLVPIRLCQGTPERYTYNGEIAAVYKSGKNKGLPKLDQVDTEEPQTKNGVLSYTLRGLCPLQKLPKAVQKAAQEWQTALELPCGTPVYSTSTEILEVLVKHGVSTAHKLTLYQAINKDLGTYYQKDDRPDSGGLRYIQPTKTVHPTLNLTSTITGRLSATAPNVQQFPRGDDDALYKSEVKRMFCTRYPDGKIVHADYTALEVVGLADFSKDSALGAALLNKTDMHCLRLSKALGEDYASVLKKCKDDAHPEHAQYAKMRTAIKPKSFQYQYGASAMGIAYSTGCTVEEAQAFIDTEKALFPEVESWFDNVVFKDVKSSLSTAKLEYIEFDGRRVPYKVGVYKSPFGTEYAFREYPKYKWVNGQKLLQNNVKATQMRNYPIQGDTAFIVQVACGKLYLDLLHKGLIELGCLPILQCHDAVDVDSPAYLVKDVAASIKESLEGAAAEINRLYKRDILTMPYPVEVECGINMQDLHKLK